MASGKSHKLVGAALAVGGYWAFKRLRGERVTFGGTVVAAGVGMVAGCLPDLFEPAVHPNHRSICHSALAATCVGIAAHRVLTDPAYTDEHKLAAAVVAPALLSHFALDAQTAKGLPLVA